MLKYSIKIDTGNFEWKEFELKEVYLSPDMSYLSGVTNASFPIAPDSSVLIRRKDRDNYNAYVTAKVTTDIRRGYVEYTKPLKEQTAKRTINYFNYSTRKYETSAITGTYIYYKDSVYYRYKKDDIDGYFVDGVFYAPENGVVNIKERVYITGNYVYIGYHRFEVFKTGEGDTEWCLRYNEQSQALKEINGKDYEVIVYPNPEDYEKVQNVVLYKKKNDVISVDTIKGGNYRYCTVIDDKTYYIEYNPSANNGDGLYGIWYEGSFFQVRRLYGDVIEVDDDNFKYTPPFDKHSITVTKQYESFTYPIEMILSSDNEGDFFILMTNYSNGYSKGDKILAVSNNEKGNSFELTPEYDNAHKLSSLYLYFNGMRYDAEEHMYDTVVLDGEYRLIYDDDEFTKAHYMLGEDRIDVVIDNGEAKRVDPLYVMVNTDGRVMTDYVTQSYTGTSGYVLSEYGSGVEWDSGAPVNFAYGVKVNGTYYKVEEKVYDNEGELTTAYTTTLDEAEQYIFEVTNTVGSNTLLCVGDTDNVLNSSFTEQEVPEIEISSLTVNMLQPDEYPYSTYGVNRIINGWQNFTFYLMDDTFGYYPVSPERGLITLYSRQEPTSSWDVNGIYKNLSFFYAIEGFNIPLPLTSNSMADVMKDVLLNEDIIDQSSEVGVNRIVDMEKIPYRLATTNYIGRLSIHLKDYDPELALNERGNVPEYVKRSFFRMSFYDSTNTQTQMLIGTMCIMLGGASISGFQGADGAIYETIDSKNVYSIYDPILKKNTSAEGLTLYAFRYNFDLPGTRKIYMRLDYNNAKTGQIIPLSPPTSSIYPDGVPLSNLMESLYFTFYMYYDDTLGYLFKPDNSSVNFWSEQTIDGILGGIIEAQRPVVKDESNIQ